jgi:protein-tyrosine-phosphatase
MAEAIARHLLAQRGAGERTIVESAGTNAGEGWPMSPEAVEALVSMGIEPQAHRSRPVTRDLTARADVIFALTPSHLRSLLAIDPTAADRAHTLDPSGEGVIDPFGQSQAFYDQTAAQIRSLIEGRLSEILG